MKLLPQHLDQGDIQAGVLIDPPQREPVEHRTAPQFHRQQQQRGAEHAVGVFRLAPLEDADGGEERVGSVFLEGVARGAEQFGQPPGVLGFVQRRVQATLRQLIAQVFSEGVDPLLPGQRGGVARIVPAHQPRPRLEREFAGGGERVLDVLQVGGEQTDSGLGFLEIEQPVAPAQVEQPALPLIEPGGGRRGAAGWRIGRVGNAEGARADVAEPFRRRERVRIRCGGLTWKREGPDAGAAGAMDVKPEPERQAGLQVGPRGPFRVAQRARIRVGQAGRLEDGDQRFALEFSHVLEVVGAGFAE